ncbi:serine/threonine protein kinase [Lacipirellula limnantheis]|uniref:mitogen-activated protein kinase kinase n=1 Tax=Lacipirellula limnantheis TaxID=2528024 RepID=A0A517TRM8_9BACT|nr:serine/threonine-protein kinase [Lacipirellula limnantheis]QDT71033.1 Serine/threonine-protein kinase PknA [Lacipirellula limnantheis]
MQRSRIGPIALEGPLGDSVDSNVLRGVHVERNMRMAVKLLPREMITRPMGGDYFSADVKLLQRLVHPNIARVLGGAIDEGQPYLALELVEGESLRSLLDRRGRLPWETTADIAESICEALQFAHSQKMIHQRLTPSRILLLPGGGVKLVGFDCQMTDKDQVVGLRSPMSVANYLAPEVFKGKSSAALPTADMFSVGVILYECLTGKLPWQAQTPSELVLARRAGPAPRVSASSLECPVWLDVLVSKLLETKRGIRLATADGTRRAILDAKRKVAEGMGTAKHAMSGKQGALAMKADRKEIAALRKHQTPTVRDESPFYERAWFLGLCLAAVIGFGAWAMWPKSEAALYAELEPLLASDDYDELRAISDEVSEFRERFPESAHNPELDDYELRVAMKKAMIDVRNLDRHGKLPSSTAQGLFAQGLKLQQFGDLMSAWELYEQAIEAVPRDAPRELAAYRRLAEKGIAEIKASPDANRSLSEMADAKLAEADELIAAKKYLPAKVLLAEFIGLYEGNGKLREQVRAARGKLQEIDARRE